MENVQWNPLKSERLKFARGVGFEEILRCKFLEIVDHPTKPHQKIMLRIRKGYVWAIPYVESNGISFLKTLYPCRKFTKIYNRKVSGHEKN